jgi:outer membrane protein assembly factor BamB
MNRAWPLALAISALTLNGCSLFGGDDDDPTEPPAELVKFSPSLKIDRRWSFSVGGDGEGKRLGLAPATDSQRVFAGGHGGKVQAVNVADGKRVWDTNTRLRLSAGPGVGDGLVVFGTSDGDVFALADADGSERWRTNIGSEILASPSVGSGVVVVRAVDGRLHGLSAQDGGPLWLVEQSVPRLSLRGNAPPVIAGVTVVAGFDNGRLGAYDLTTGETNWEVALGAPQGRTELERLVDISAGVQVVGDDVYGVGFQGRAVSIALETGMVVWQRELSSYAGLGTDWNNIYISDADSEVVALNRRGGRPMWTHDKMRQRDLTAPTVLGEVLAVGDFEGYLHWLSVEDGSLLARTKAGGGRVTSAPRLVDDLLVTQTDSGEVAAFSAEPRRR